MNQIKYYKKTLAVIKQLDLQKLSEHERQAAYKEAKILSSLKHPNIIKFREVYTTKMGRLCIVMDYADGNFLIRKVVTWKRK